MESLPGRRFTTENQASEERQIQGRKSAPTGKVSQGLPHQIWCREEAPPAKKRKPWNGIKLGRIQNFAKGSGVRVFTSARQV